MHLPTLHHPASVLMRPTLAAAAIALALIAVACGSEDAPAAVSDHTGEIPLIATSAPDLSRPAPQPDATAPAAAIGRAPATGSFTFTQDGFRTEVKRAVTVGDFEPYMSNEEARVTVTLRNLSSPSGDLQTRATINFGGPFANMLVLPTPDGVRLAHLHRDGSLRETADDGRFT